MKADFYITEPVEGGYAWFDVRSESNYLNEYPNFTVASFFKDMPNAKKEAIALRDRLNQYAFNS